MKKIKAIFICSFLLALFTCSASFAANNRVIEVNGQNLDADVKIIDGRSLIPLRAVGEALGLEVNYDNNNGVITLVSNNANFTTSQVFINSKNGVYGAEISGGTDIYNKYNFNIPLNGLNKVNVKPVNLNNKVYVPVRVICDSFGAPVTVENNKIVIGSCFTDQLSSNDKVMKLITTYQAEQNKQYTVSQHAPKLVKVDAANYFVTASDNVVKTLEYVTMAQDMMNGAGTLYSYNQSTTKALILINNAYKAQEQAVDDLNKAINLCGNYEDMQLAKQYAQELLDICKQMPANSNQAIKNNPIYNSFMNGEISAIVKNFSAEVNKGDLSAQ